MLLGAGGRRHSQARRCPAPGIDLCGDVKLANVIRVEVGTPGDFSGLSKQEIVDKLEQRAGPKAVKLFEKFMRDMQKLKDEPDASASSVTYSRHQRARCLFGATPNLITNLSRDQSVSNVKVVD